MYVEGLHPKSVNMCLWQLPCSTIPSLWHCRYVRDRHWCTTESRSFPRHDAGKVIGKLLNAVSGSTPDAKGSREAIRGFPRLENDSRFLLMPESLVSHEMSVFMSPRFWYHSLGREVYGLAICRGERSAMGQGLHIREGMSLSRVSSRRCLVRNKPLPSSTG